jgi:hypothetical protein
MNKKDLIWQREGGPSTHDFIEATWLQGLYHGNAWFKKIDEKIYYENYRKVIRNILRRPETEIFMACLHDDHDLILAYSVYEKDCLHYVYCKSDWRRIGLGSDLMQKPFTQVSQLTKTGEAIWKKKYPKVIFNPFF